jgi:hypothetical protein
MNKRKIIGIVVSLTLVTTFLSAAATTNPTYKVINNEHCLELMQPDPTPFLVEWKPLYQSTEWKTIPRVQSLGIGTDVQVTTFGENDGHPSITIDHDGNPIIVYDHETAEGYHELYLQRSPDGGETWPDDQKYYLIGNETLSAINPIIETSDNGLGGAMIFQQENQPDPLIYVMSLDDLDDPESWYLGYFDQSAVTDWIGETSGAVYGTHYGTWSYISDVIWEDYNETETLRIAWSTDVTNATNYQGLFFYADENTYFSHPTSAAGSNLYGAAQRNRASGSIIQIAWGPTKPDLVFEDWEYATCGVSRSNTTHPALAASGDYAYLAVQDDQNGNDDIFCYTPGAVSWVKHTIADSNEDEMYPSITAFENIAICTFVKNGDLYMSRSDDAGETWSTPEQINDESATLVEEYRCADIEGPYIAWMDNRNTNYDIYSDKTTLPWVAITTVTGGLFGVTAGITNIGNEDAENVPWSFHVQGGILGLINTITEGTIDIPMGDTVSIKSAQLFGLGKISIVVIADGVMRDSEGTHLIFFTIL